jgi:hypothetical protein
VDGIAAEVDGIVSKLVATNPRSDAKDLPR